MDQRFQRPSASDRTPGEPRPGSEPDLPPRMHRSGGYRPRDRRRRGRRRGAAARGSGGTHRGRPGRPARGRPCRDRAGGAARPDLARRLPHAQCGKRRALCRQGQECPQAAVFLRAGHRAAAGAHPAHDRGHRHGRDHLHRDRNRGAAARSQPDQAVAAALQRAAARRQIVSLYPDHRATIGRRRSSSIAARRSRPGRYFGPFASAGAVNRTITALQRAFLVRSCTDAFFESRTRPCLLYQIRRCSGPCTGEIDFPGYTELVREATDFLSGRSRSVKQQLAGEMEKASGRARIRDRGALPRPPRRACRRSSRSRASIRAPSRRPTCSPSTRRAAIPASRCSSSAPGRTGATAPIFRARRNPSRRRRCWPRSSRSSTTTSRRRSSSCCRTRSRKASCWPSALSIKAGFKVEVSTPQRGEKKEMIAHALTNAREALGRKLADTATQGRLLQGLVTTLGLPQPPKRIEVYDNSHIQGTNAVGAMIVAGPDGFIKNQYRKFNIRSEGLTPGRRLRDDARGAAAALQAAAVARRGRSCQAQTDDDSFPQWPDLVIIDGGRGQLNAVEGDFRWPRARPRFRCWRWPRGRTATPAARPCSCRAARPLKLEPRESRACFSSSACATEAHRFVISSRTASCAKKDIRSQVAGNCPASGPSRKQRFVAPFWNLKGGSCGPRSPTWPRSPASAPRAHARFWIFSTPTR